MARPMPEIRPPPPTGTTTVSMSSTCSSSSRPIVPCPATIAGSSKAWISVMPLSRTTRLAYGSLGLVEVLAVEDHRCAVAARGLDLRDRGSRRHDNCARYAEIGRRQRHSLGVVAGACGYDALRLLLVAQRRDLVYGAPHLEGIRLAAGSRPSGGSHTRPTVPGSARAQWAS